ncbi:MAG: NHL repeat-containing protein [Clostridia bacterium]|nr:NHL repeat-containing protein [Clostridia bacterium]
MKNKRGNRRLLAALLVCGIVLSLCGFTPYESYTYSTATGVEEYVYSPAPFTAEGFMDGNTIGTALERPKDFAFDAEGNMYIVDSSLNKLLVLDPQGKVKQEITGFTNEGVEETFSSPSGFHLAPNGWLYICDTKNNRVVALDKDGALQRLYTCPESPLLAENYVFEPSKIGVDVSGTMYIINANEYSGVMKITAAGEFVGFIGSNKAVVNPVLRIWKSIMSEAQQKQLVSFVPVEYKNISMDEYGFLYAVSASTSQTNPVKRLNLSGTDILIRSGYVTITGDVIAPEGEGSVLVDICSTANGDYYVLDANKCRVFAYNQEGYLLYVFGGRGTQVGTFSNPVAIEYRDGKLYVLDEVTATVTVFSKTDYAEKITLAEDAYYAGEYEKSMNCWKDVIKVNAFFEMAYLQMGKIHLHNGDNEEAMRCFELGNYRGDKITFMTGFNKAFTEFRKDLMSQYLGVMIIGAVVLVVASSVVRRIRQKKTGNGRERD